MASNGGKCRGAAGEVGNRRRERGGRGGAVIGKETETALQW